MAKKAQRIAKTISIILFIVTIISISSSILGFYNELNVQMLEADAEGFNSILNLGLMFGTPVLMIMGSLMTIVGNFLVFGILMLIVWIPVLIIKKREKKAEEQNKNSEVQDVSTYSDNK